MRTTTLEPERRGLRWLWPGADVQVLTPRGAATAVASGARQRIALPQGVATRLAQGTANLMPNPSFEVNTGRWFTNGAGVQSITRITTDSVFGGACCEVVVDGAQAAQGLISDFNAGLQVPVSPSTSYALSAHLKQIGGDATALIGIDWYTAASAYISTHNTTAARQPAWSRHSFTATSPATAAYAVPFFRQNAAAAGTYRVDGAQFEVGSRATSYCDGSLGEGYAWTGAADASASTRTESRLQVTAAGWRAERGGCVVSVTPEWPAADTAEHVVLHWRADASNEWRLAFDGAGSWRLAWIDRGQTQAITAPAVHAAEARVVLTAAWTPRRLHLAVNEDVREAPRTGTPAAMPAAGLIEIGRRADVASGYLDGLIGAVGFAPELSRSTATVAARLGRPPRWADLGGQ